MNDLRLGIGFCRQVHWRQALTFGLMVVVQTPAAVVSRAPNFVHYNTSVLQWRGQGWGVGST